MKKERDKKKVIKDIVVPICIATLLVFTFTRFFGIGFIDGVSMKPTYHNGQIFLYSKSNDVESGDVVVFRARELKADLVKRVIATENNKLEIKNGKTYIDGTLINESFVKHQDKSTALTVVIPRGYVFVMGDNRTHSIDSRRFGLVKVTDIYGKVF